MYPQGNESRSHLGSKKEHHISSKPAEVLVGDMDSSLQFLEFMGSSWKRIGYSGGTLIRSQTTCPQINLSGCSSSMPCGAEKNDITILQLWMCHFLVIFLRSFYHGKSQIVPPCWGNRSFFPAFFAKPTPPLSRSRWSRRSRWPSS